jgi:hypothetical protein
MVVLTAASAESARSVTSVPPAVLPVATLRSVTSGAVASISVAELTVKLAAGRLPKETAMAPVRPVPVMVPWMTNPPWKAF